MGIIKQPSWTRNGGSAKITRKTGLNASGRYKRSQTARKIFTGVVPVFLVAFVAAFVAASVFAPAQSSDAATPISATITSGNYYLNVQSEEVGIDVEAYPGAGHMSVAQSTVKTKTNAPSGYKLYLGLDPTSESSGLCLETDDTECLDTLAGAVPASQKALAADTWGYAVSSSSTGIPTEWSTGTHSVVTNITPDSTQTFAAVPEHGSEQLVQTVDSANSSSLDDNNFTALDLYYGVRATIAKPAGTYSNTVAYTAVSDISESGTTTVNFNPATYARTARYEDQTWDQTLTITTSILTNMDVSTPKEAPTVTLTGGPSSTTRTYTCANATQFIENNLLKVSCTLPQAYAATYSIEVKIPDFDIDITSTYQYTVDWTTISLMQEMTKDVCTSAGNVTTSQVMANSNPVPEVYLQDLRGGGGAFQTGKYRVRKLADGNCWMTENMALPQASTQTYYSYDTHLTQDMGSSLGYATTDGIISWKPTAIRSSTSSPYYGTWVTPDELTGSDGITGGPTDTSTTNDHTYYGYGSQKTTTTDTYDTEETSGQNAETQNIGAYYNWPAATARSGGDTAEVDAPNDVCPLGWQLPSSQQSGGDNYGKSFTNLLAIYGMGNNAEGSLKSRRYPFSLVFSGYYYWYNGYLSDQGSNGVWWSATSNGSSNAFFLYTSSSVLNPRYNNFKYYGWSLRCVSVGS